LKLYRLHHEPEAYSELYERITPRNGLFAVAAVAPEEEPAQEGDVVVPADRRSALWAAGTRVDDRLTIRYARDADVQEAAEDETYKEAEELDHNLEYTVLGLGSRLHPYPYFFAQSIQLMWLRFVLLVLGQT